ncbi:TLD domain-containing protein 1 isoform X2 [Asparagus officinalis]|uniref:TLD domain-containing protein 1 isoform X2 n=1 Tax=Asparagus officinalis TaxID=4686 RepID=UPI00098E277F|nr:TLD domain-containing protein 1 isoform X2 [Asparagus officinalis]
MGNAQSPPADPRFAMASRAFSKQELDDLKALFDSLAAQSQSNAKFISSSVFQGYFGIKGVLGVRMFDLFTQSRKDGRLTYEDFVIAKEIYEKGTRDEIEEFVYQLCDINGDGIISRSDLEAVMHFIYDTIFSPDGAQPCLSSGRDTMEVFLSAATLSKEVEGTESRMSFVDFRNWCKILPSVGKFLGSLLISPDSGFQVPYLHHPEKLSHDLLSLRKEYAWHIGGALAQQELEEWKLLYHSAIHGLSFNTFMAHITSGDGPTILVIKDTEGYIYGGYASQPWERQSDFYGDMKSFLFQLYPQASIFRPTGANNNLQWCALNFSSDSIPNGVGFGGKANHFGLFLSANFDQGHTFECTTFSSPCLSRTNKIRPEAIECWGIQVKGLENEQNDAIKETVLERFKEDRNMLKMVGLANSSE